MGHNVFHVLPNEVPILVIAALVSSWVRRSGWASLGFRRPASWTQVILIAIGAAVLRIVLGELVIDPLASRYWPAEPPAQAESITGNPGMALAALLFVWVFAAFGEEIAYRGYLLGRGADVGRRTPAAWWLAMIGVSLLFGLGHYSRGPGGVIDSGVAGLILGTAFLFSGRVLWTSILAHGLIDSYAVIVVYLGGHLS